MQDLGNAGHQQIDDIIEVSPWAIDSFWAACLDEVKGVNLKCQSRKPQRDTYELKLKGSVF